MQERTDKEVSELPVMVSLTFESDGRTLYGTTPECAGVVVESLGAVAVGAATDCGRILCEKKYRKIWKFQKNVLYL